MAPVPQPGLCSRWTPGCFNNHASASTTPICNGNQFVHSEQLLSAVQSALG
jgi:hypothetical protein